MITYANQKQITIHKPKYQQDFLQVGKDEWMEAFATLPRGAFGLYLYLCGNKDGYRFGLSSAAVQQALGVSDSTYRRGIEQLLEAGYLLQSGNDKNLHFYLKPQPTTYVKKAKKPAAAPALCEAAPPPDDNDGDAPCSSLPSYSSSQYEWDWSHDP